MSLSRSGMSLMFGETGTLDHPYTTTLPPMDALPGACPWCSTPWSASFHGGRCPRVKAIERYPDGSMKRVEFFEERGL